MDIKYSWKLASLLGYILWKYGLKQWANNGEIKKFPNSLIMRAAQTFQNKPFKTGFLNRHTIPLGSSEFT